jgi:arylsulfatase A-like enzyme
MSRLILFLLCLTHSVRGAEQPNILFLFADDHCYDGVHALGRSDIDTPHLDRLAERGTTFTHAYNMGSWIGAVCVASRTMLITGRSLWRAKAIYDQTEGEREAGRLWPQLLSAVGYRTYMTGKWHIRADASRTFDITRDVRGGMPKDKASGYSRPIAGKPDPWSPFDRSLGGFWEGGTHWTEVVGNHGVDFLKQASAEPSPFFMYIAFNAPHDPRQSPKEYVDRYPLDRIDIPANYLPEYPHHREIGCDPKLRDESLAPFPRTEHAVKVHRQEYHAIITHMDDQIGRILSALDASGKADNTWIFYTADHGLAVGQHGLMGKQNMYDHSLRVPFIVVGPGVKAGQRVSAPIYLQDVMPTTLELAGAEKPEHVEFQSVLPLLRNADAPRRETIYAAYLELQRAVIHEGWKLIYYPKSKVTRLYDLAQDPLEKHDLANSAAEVERVQSLWAKLQEEQQTWGDSLKLKMP